MDQQREALLVFRGCYGRLSVKGAQALTEGYHHAAVALASRGEGKSPDPTLKALRRARRIVDVALRNARDHGNERAAIVEAGLQARAAVQEEWQVRLPVHSDAEAAV